jgi:hypothetical protein
MFRLFNAAEVVNNRLTSARHVQVFCRKQEQSTNDWRSWNQPLNRQIKERMEMCRLPRMSLKEPTPCRI